MALFALFHAPRRTRIDRQVVNDWIAGNLCRCTGYRPIVDAALAACANGVTDRFAAQEAEVASMLAQIDAADDVFVGSDASVFAAPARIDSLAALYAAHPDAVLVGGGTDVGLWITKQLRSLPKIIWLGRVNGLDTVDAHADAVTFGATVSHEAAIPYLSAIDPDLGELMRRFAGLQIRSVGTIGGNIANGSPIGDTPPAMIALGATLTLQLRDAQRSLPLEDFFIAYGKQDRRPGEFVRSVQVPKLKPNERFRCYKISKRFDQDISAVMGAFKLTLDGTRIAEARIAFGGMAATPKRASATEAALHGVDLSNPRSWQSGLTALAGDFSPITDQRATEAYRRDIAQALLRKALTEIAGTATRQTRIVGRRELHDVARA